MLDLPSLGRQIAERRRALKLSQASLAQKARVSRATLDALENGRAGELGFSKIVRLLAVIGMELRLETAASHRPTFEDLLEEERNDQGLDRRR